VIDYTPQEPQDSSYATPASSTPENPAAGPKKAKKPSAIRDGISIAALGLVTYAIGNSLRDDPGNTHADTQDETVPGRKVVNEMDRTIDQVEDILDQLYGVEDLIERSFLAPGERRPSLTDVPEFTKMRDQLVKKREQLADTLGFGPRARKAYDQAGAYAEAAGLILTAVGVSYAIVKGVAERYSASADAAPKMQPAKRASQGYAADAAGAKASAPAPSPAPLRTSPPAQNP
jgi:hypothetical protein